jgi:hypothetical protein
MTDPAITRSPDLSSLFPVPVRSLDNLHQGSSLIAD